MTMQTVPTIATVLKPCRPEKLRPGDAPVLPKWYPLDRRPTEDDPDPDPYTDDERTSLRRARSIAEAVQGPYDGQNGVAYNAHGEPAPVLYFADGVVGYRLDMIDSNRHVLTYRYSPADSLAHRETIRVVEQVYADHGAAYADEARQGDRQDHPGGEAFGL